MVFTLDSKQFPGYDSVYLLSEPGASRQFRAAMDLSVDQAFAITRGEFETSSPIAAHWQMGRTDPGDIIWTSLAVPVLVSRRVLGILSAKGFSGWTTYLVTLRGKDGSILSGYYGLAVNGRCGTVDNSRSVRFSKITPGGTFVNWRGLYFAAESWDGSDLFMPSDAKGWIFVRREVKRALEAASVRNIVFTPLTQIERLML